MTAQSNRSLTELAAHRADVVDRLASVAESDPDVLAVWLVGSLGRGDGDDLSDVDAVLVQPDALISLPRTEMLLHRLGDPLLVVEAGQNAPAGGEMVSGLFDAGGLPLWVDLHVWPESFAVRPVDALVVLQREPDRPPPNPDGFAAIVDRRPTRAGSVFTQAERHGFELMMLSVSAKYHARGGCGRTLLEAAGGSTHSEVAAPQDLLDALDRLRGIVPEAAFELVAALVRLVAD